MKKVSHWPEAVSECQVPVHRFRQCACHVTRKFRNRLLIACLGNRVVKLVRNLTAQVE